MSSLQGMYSSARFRISILTDIRGGTAACVAAGRLARADPGLSILLVEGGKNNYNDPTVVNPAMYLIHLAPGSQTALFYEANSEEALNGRKAIVPCEAGKITVIMFSTTWTNLISSKHTTSQIQISINRYTDTTAPFTSRTVPTLQKTRRKICSKQRLQQGMKSLLMHKISTKTSEDSKVLVCSL